MSGRRRSRGRWGGLVAASVVVAFLAWWGTATVIAVTLSIVFENEEGVDTQHGWKRFVLLAVPALLAGVVATVLAKLDRRRLIIPPTVATAVAGAATVVLGVLSIGPVLGAELDDRTWALWLWVTVLVHVAIAAFGACLGVAVADRMRSPREPAGAGARTMVGR